MLKLREPLFIGGINRFSSIPVSADVHASFNGCIEKVMFCLVLRYLEASLRAKIWE